MGGNTFDTIGLGQLRAILDKFPGQLIPRLALHHAEIDVRAGEVVGVELENPHPFHAVISPRLFTTHTQPPQVLFPRELLLVRKWECRWVEWHISSDIPCATTELVFDAKASTGGVNG